MKPTKHVSAESRMAGTSHLEMIQALAHKIRLRAVAAVLATVLGIIGSPCLGFGQVQLPSVNLGGSNFEDAFGAPGWLLQEFVEGDFANELKDSRGETVPGPNRITAYSATTHVVFVSQRHVLGGWLAGEILQPMADIDVQLANRPRSRVRGLADLTAGVGFQWAPTKLGDGVFADRLILDFGLPTGKYSDTNAVNIGNNAVVVEPFYAFTYEIKNIEFSARFHYLWNSVNHDPFVGFGVRNVQAGQAVHVNYSVSYEVQKNVRVGLNGYWLQQVTKDEVNGVPIANSLERTVGLGLGLQIQDKNIWYHLNGYEEFDVRNRSRGAKVIFRLSIAMPSPKV